MKKVLTLFLTFFVFSCGSEVPERNEISTRNKIPETVENLRRANDGQIIMSAKEAYIFGYPLVLSQACAPDSGDFINRPVNYPKTDSKFKVFPYPDAQTYYSCIWLDVSKAPVYVELDLPETGFAVFDAWTNVILNSADFKDDRKTLKVVFIYGRSNVVLPAGFIEIRLNTSAAFFVSVSKNGERKIKVYTDGKPGKPLKGLPETAEFRLEQVRNMSIEDFFNKLNVLMLYNRPFRKDARALELLQDIGAASGMHFETSSFSEEVLGKIKSIPADFAKESAHTAIPWEQMQGQTADAGYYKRAKNAFQNVDGIIDAEAVRLISKTDAGGETFDSFANRYVLHFEKNQIPQGKWSLTAYDAAGFLMKNPLNRYALTYNGVKKKADGSVDIYIQKNQPSKDKTVNWLPVSQKSFALVFKNYPSDKPFDAAALPAVKKAKK